MKNHRHPVLNEYGYQTVFDAISSSIKSSSPATFEISVDTFLDKLGTPNMPPGPVTPDQPNDPAVARAASEVDKVPNPMFEALERYWSSRLSMVFGDGSAKMNNKAISFSTEIVGALREMRALGRNEGKEMYLDELRQSTSNTTLVAGEAIGPNRRDQMAAAILTAYTTYCGLSKNGFDPRRLWEIVDEFLAADPQAK